MDHIIVTVCDEVSESKFDIDVPINIAIGDLLIDITQTLEGYEPDLHFDLTKCLLYSPRFDSVLDSKRTLKQECIWNGDYLCIKQSDTNINS